MASVHGTDCRRLFCGWTGSTFSFAPLDDGDRSLFRREGLMRTGFTILAFALLASCGQDSSRVAGDNALEDAERARDGGDQPSAPTDFTPRLPPQPPESMPTEPQTPAPQ